MRDVTEAHFLHQRSGLEAVLRPPVPQPTALAWIPGREELIVASRDGCLHTVDPVLGTRVIARDLGEVAVLSLHPDRKRWLALTRAGEWIIGSIVDGVLNRGRHPFAGGMEAFFLGEWSVMVGDEVAGRTLLVVGAGVEKGRMRVPPRVVPLHGDDGKMLLARSTPAGLHVIKFGKNPVFPEPDESTAHRRRVSGTRYVIGLTPTGVAVWTRAGGQPRSMRLPDVTAGDVSPDGRFLGLGTRAGAVALAALDRLDNRAKPHLVKAFDTPVTSVSFSERGRWLATGGEALQIWTWED
jgi:hypothetical protein